MELKNAKLGNLQLSYVTKRDGVDVVDFVHIPGLATVEIEDSLFNKLCAARTKVEEQKRVVTKVEAETPVEMDRKPVYYVDFEPTGKIKEVSLLKEMIRKGDVVIVSRAKVSEREVDEVLTKAGIDVKGMPAETKSALYDKLV